MASASEASSEQGEMFAVEPKTDCPHLQVVTSNDSLTIDASIGCGTCDHKGENWLCLICSAVYCSRYINSHMVAHNEDKAHMVALSFSDLSVWCYGCDSYITSPSLKSIIKAAELAKFDPAKSGEPSEVTGQSTKTSKVAEKTSGSEVCNPDDKSAELKNTLDPEQISGSESHSPDEKPAPLTKIPDPEQTPGSESRSPDEEPAPSDPEQTSGSDVCSPDIKPIPPKSKLSTKELIKRIKAVIYGNCIGDAIGLLTEFMTKEEARKIYAKKKVGPFYVPWAMNLEYTMKADDFHRFRFPVGDWTDDSDQMILILQMLLENKGQVVPTDFASKLIGWMQHGFKELGDTGGCGVGSTTLKVLINKDFRSDPHKVARQVWEESGRYLAPNGGVMRTSILGTKDFDNIPQVIENTKQICYVTHADPRCVASCVAVTTAIALMLQGEYMDSTQKYDVNAISEKAYEFAAQFLETQEQKDELYKCMFSTLEDLQLGEDKKIGYTYKCLGAGFWTFKQNNFRKALTALIMEGGDADTNGAVGGALLGCKLGLSEFPNSWLNGLKHKDWLDGYITQ